MPQIIFPGSTGKRLRLRYVASVYYRKYHFTIFRDDRYHVQMELRLKVGQENIEPRKRFWVDSHPKSFKTEKDVFSFLESAINT